MEAFLEHTRSKFVGFNVKNDSGSLAGLPLPIHEGVKVLNQVNVSSSALFITVWNHAVDLFKQITTIRFKLFHNENLFRFLG